MKAIEVNGVSKKFGITKDFENRDSLLERLKIKKPKEKEIWALKNVEFEVEGGEWLGIIGENGSGKTTLLKIIGKVLSPTEGEVVTRGKTASILGLGTGFKDELTARENVYLYSSLMGLDKEEIENRYKNIVSFSGLYEYMNTKFKKFSDGMKMRLAFSTIINVGADILLSDEILTVGDGEFQDKCFEKLKKFKEEGKTIIIVSHDLNSIKEWCDRSIFLDDGYIREKGDPEKVINCYREFLTWKGENENFKKFKNKLSESEVIKDLIFRNSNGKESYIFQKGESLKGMIKTTKKLQNIKIDFIEKNAENKKMSIYVNSLPEKEGFSDFNIHTDSLCLDKGNYKVKIRDGNGKDLQNLDLKVIEGQKDLPETLVINSSGNSAEFPEGEFYAFGNVSNLIEDYNKGESVCVYYKTDIKKIKDHYEKGKILGGDSNE